MTDDKTIAPDMLRLMAEDVQYVISNGLVATEETLPLLAWATDPNRETIRDIRPIMDQIAIKATYEVTNKIPEQFSGGASFSSRCTYNEKSGIKVDMWEKRHRKQFWEQRYDWSRHGKRYKHLRLSFTVGAGWFSNVLAHDIATVGGFMTLTANRVPAPDGFTAWEATWAKQTFKKSQEHTVSGFIVRGMSSGETVRCASITEGVNMINKTEGK